MATPAAVSMQSRADIVSHLGQLISESPQAFLRPTHDLQLAAISAAKALLDPLATNIADAQTARRNENRRKRKRADRDDGEQEPILQLRQIHTHGFGVKQVWEQARRILDAAQREVERDMLSHQHVKGHDTVRNNQTDLVAKHHLNAVELDSDQDQRASSDESRNGDLDVLASQMIDEELGEDISEENAEEEEDIQADSDIMASSDEDGSENNNLYVSDPNGLNDGFFSIDDFNKQTQFLEQMDVRGDEDNPSDEDEVDWDADPLAMSAANKSRYTTQNPDADDEDNDEEDKEGPTFDDAESDDLQDEDGMSDEDQDLDGMLGGMSNANEIQYKDFFEPPPQKLSKRKRMRALPKTQPPPLVTTAANQTSSGRFDNVDVDEQRLQSDLDRAIADVRRDLLDSDEDAFSEDDEFDSEDELGSRRAKDNNKNMSTHEKQRAAIAAEIRRLEAANVAKRDWQLSGEARAVDRPINSLIEEDLDFERTGKPIAPVTAETTEEIDALIKRRILAREFDEVVRRVPGSLNLANETRRGRIDLDDSKPQNSLGEIYEAEHQKNADPLSYIDKRSAATKKAHDEIDILWKQVREQLLLLSNLHFKPKRVDIEIKTVADKPRITMEDARPVGEIESGEGGMLAPQEVYRPGADGKKLRDEIILAGGAAMSKDELSREEKLRRRRREKERSRKSKDNKEVNVLGKQTVSAGHRQRREKQTEKADIIADLKRGGVKVIGQGGDLQKLGKQKNGAREGQDIIGSNLKL